MNEKFTVYDYKDGITRSECCSKLFIERVVYPEEENLTEETTSLISKGKDELNRMLDILKQQEEIRFQLCKDAVDDWVKVAKEISIVQLALGYLNKSESEVKHTNNTWVRNEYCWGYIEIISNRVYKMWIKFHDLSYGGNNEYRVSWHFGVKHPQEDVTVVIKNQTDKKYTDKEKAFKYIEGRKKAYSKYFTEVNPVVPKDYAEYFKVNGVLLPDYVVEETEGE